MKGAGPTLRGEHGPEWYWKVRIALEVAKACVWIGAQAIRDGFFWPHR